MKDVRVEISLKTVLMTILALLGFYLLFHVRDILVYVFLSIIFSSALNPTISKLERKRIPRPIGIFLIYLTVLAFIAVIAALVVPPLAHQTSVLLSQLNLPQFLSNLNLSQIQNTVQNYESILGSVGGSIPTVIGAVVGTFSGVIVGFTILVMTFYMILERRHIHKHIAWMFTGTEKDNKAEKFITSLEQQLGGWVRGQLTLMFIIGLMTYIGLSLLNVPFALPLALIAGILEVVPNIGPTIASVPAILVALFMVSPVMGLITFFLYILIQQLENNLIVPKVMSDAVGIHPLVTIVVLLSGFRLGGVAGMLLAIPIFITIRTILHEIYNGKNPLAHHAEEK